MKIQFGTYKLTDDNMEYLKKMGVHHTCLDRLCRLLGFVPCDKETLHNDLRLLANPCNKASRGVWIDQTKIGLAASQCKSLAILESVYSNYL